MTAKRSLVPRQPPKVGDIYPPFNFTQCDVSGEVMTALISMPHLQDSPQNSESRKWSEVGPGWLAVRAGAHLQTWPTDTRGLERPPHPGLCSVGRSTSLLGSSAIPCGRKWHHLSCCLSAETRFLLFCECLSCGAHAARKQGVVAPSQTLSRLPISCPNCKMKNAGWGTCHRLPTPRPPVKVLASEANREQIVH